MPIAFAAAINPEFIGGSAGIPNILADTDQLLVSTMVESDEAVTNENVIITAFTGSEAFDECIQISSTEFYCTYTSDQMDNAPGSYGGMIKYITDAQQILAQESFFLEVDGLAPEIDAITIPTYFTNEINLEYSVDEKSCAMCNSCSGFAEMQITMDGNVAYSTPLEVDGCVLEETKTIATTALSGVQEGEYEACVVFVDHVGLEAEACQQVTIDLSSPTLAPENIRLLNEFGEGLTHVKDEPLSARLIANISDLGSGLNVQTVTADLSAFNPQAGSGYETMGGVCTDVGEGMYTCTWQLIVDLTFTEEDGLDKQLPLVISVGDLAGNEFELNGIFGVRQDATKPIVTEMTTLRPGFLNKKNNTLIIEVQEAPTDSGLDNKQVFLDFENFNMGIQQVDRCVNTGADWECYLEEFTVPTSINSGRSGYIKVQKVVDDVGNLYDSAESITQIPIQYDNEAPRVLNITVLPLGQDIDVIQQDDIVMITAFIEETVSGIDPNAMLIDFSEFSELAGEVAATACYELEDDLFVCEWEYTGDLRPGQVRVSVITGDVAGNSQDSKEYGKFGTGRVVQTQDLREDYWQDETAVTGVPDLNPNFLFFSDSGTLVRLDVELARAAGSSYVHQFTVNECYSSIELPALAGMQDQVQGTVETGSYLESPIENQYYYPNVERENKQLLVRVPPFFSQIRMENATGDIADGGYVDIVCVGEVVQGRTQYSNLFVPNEQVNITARVNLLSGLYTEPGIATVDKIQRGQKFLDGLDKYVLNWLKVVVEWVGKICRPINTVVQTVNNLGTIVSSIHLLTKNVGAGSYTQGIQSSISQLSTMLNKLWLGGPSGKGCEGPLCPSPYGFPSVGLICDAVLCQNCGNQWNDILTGKAGPNGGAEGKPGVLQLIGKGFDTKRQEQDVAAGRATAPAPGAVATEGPAVPDDPGIGGSSRTYSDEGQPVEYDRAGLVQLNLNPHNNIVVALVCWPPCLSGVYSQLLVYKQIVMSYNTCLNIAAVRGEDLQQCDQFLKAQICQQMVGAFLWDWLYDLALQFATKLVATTVEKAIATQAQCPPDADEKADVPPTCHAWRSFQAVVVIGATAVDTYKMWETQIKEFQSWGNQSNAENQEEMDEHLTEGYEEYVESEEYITDQTGGDPYAG